MIHIILNNHFLFLLVHINNLYMLVMLLKYKVNYSLCLNIRFLFLNCNLYLLNHINIYLMNMLIFYYLIDMCLLLSNILYINYIFYNYYLNQNKNIYFDILKYIFFQYNMLLKVKVILYIYHMNKIQYIFLQMYYKYKIYINH